jgi:hypothetical protein
MDLDPDSKVVDSKHSPDGGVLTKAGTKDVQGFPFQNRYILVCLIGHFGNFYGKMFHDFE